MVPPRFQKDSQKDKEVALATSYDFVIPYVHSGDGGQELRKALATLKNVLDWSGKVWIVGDYESWFEDLSGLEHLSCPPGTNKWVGIQEALMKACKTLEVSEQFYYSNDDIFCNDQFFHIPPLYREPIDEQTKDVDGFYHQSLIATKRLLIRKLGDRVVLNYETHTPLFMDKNKLATTLNEIKAIQDSGYMPLQLRTYYGNMWNIGGEFYEDGKHKEGLAITSS
jgi:hypothetical protein